MRLVSETTQRRCTTQRKNFRCEEFPDTFTGGNIEKSNKKYLTGGKS